MILRLHQNRPDRSWPMDFQLCIEWKMNEIIKSPVGLFLVPEQEALNKWVSMVYVFQTAKYTG